MPLAAVAVLLVLVLAFAGSYLVKRYGYVDKASVGSAEGAVHDASLSTRLKKSDEAFIEVGRDKDVQEKVC